MNLEDNKILVKTKNRQVGNLILSTGDRIKVLNSNGLFFDDVVYTLVGTVGGVKKFFKFYSHGHMVVITNEQISARNIKFISVMD